MFGLGTKTNCTNREDLRAHNHSPSALHGNLPLSFCGFLQAVTVSRRRNDDVAQLPWAAVADFQTSNTQSQTPQKHFWAARRQAWRLHASVLGPAHCCGRWHGPANVVSPRSSALQSMAKPPHANDCIITSQTGSQTTSCLQLSCMGRVAGWMTSCRALGTCF